MDTASELLCAPAPADDRRAAAEPADAAEASRLAAVARYDILDTPPDGAFDRVAALAARWFGTPIATVSIVDEDRVWFKASRGLQGVTQVGRHPGLCASAIQQADPYVVNDALTDPRTVMNPLVHGELGIRFYAGAPILTGDGYRLGTVNVLDTQPRSTTPDDLSMLRDLAAVVMDQLELRLSALQTLRGERELRERAERDKATIEAFAVTLQRTLLPPVLPDIPGLELACHYHAASPRHVGGDFYDVFSLDARRWAFFLGDVCGHGTAAAALTSLTRYTLRAAAWHDTDPVSVLSELNTALLTQPRPDRRFATVVFGLLEPAAAPGAGFDVTLGTGGHIPACWLHRATSPGPGDVEELGPDGGMLVGAFPEARFTSRRLRLAPGEALLFYTDGLIDTRGGGASFGEDGLSAFLSSHVGRGAARLVADLATLVRGLDPALPDDVALLAMSAPETG